MPSNDNPGFYERASAIAASRADDFLKSLTPDDCLAETGSVEMPLGYVMLVRVTRDMIASYVSREGDPWMSEARNFSPGWYIVKSDDNGLIWGMEYGELDSTFNEERARADFAEAEAVADEWWDDED